MAGNDRFDPMLLESQLHYPETPCKEITEAGAIGSSSLDLSPSPEQRDGTGTQVGEEHGPSTLAQLIGNGSIIPQQEQQEEGPVLNPRREGSKKRKKWSEDETDLLLAAVASEKKKSKSGVDNEPLWEGVARGVPGRSEKKCRRRMETLRKSFKRIKDCCNKEGKEFAELNKAKMKLATRMTESWYNQIRDHCPSGPAKKFRAEGSGSCSTSGEVELGLDNTGVLFRGVATTSGPRGRSQITAAFIMMRNEGKGSEACNGRLGEASTIDYRAAEGHQSGRYHSFRDLVPFDLEDWKGFL